MVESNPGTAGEVVQGDADQRSERTDADIQGQRRLTPIVRSGPAVGAEGAYPVLPRPLGAVQGLIRAIDQVAGGHTGL